MISPRTKKNLRKELRESLMAKLGLVIVALVLFVAIFAPFLAPHPPSAQNLDNAQQPPVGFTKTETVTDYETVNGSVEQVNETVAVPGSWNHPLGTDSLGRDMLSRVIYGARTSLLVGVFSTLLATFIGASIGLVAGYYGGRVDDLLMRSADVMLTLPGLVLAITLIGLFGPVAVDLPDPFAMLGLASEMPGTITLPGTVILVIALVSWVQFARIARGEAVSVREVEYVKAAKSIGAGNPFIIRRHIFPNSFTPILVLATIRVASAILLESSLSFLGFSGTNLSWGFDIAQGRDYLATSWWIATFAGLAIVIAITGINLLGDWLRDSLDPDLQGGNA